MPHQDNTTTLADLKQAVARFVQERDWQQFHDPKSLSMAMALETSELMEYFTWAGNREEAFELLAKHRESIEQELVDVLHVVLAFANACNIDITSALLKKMELNAQKYPVEASKGKNKKYTEI